MIIASICESFRYLQIFSLYKILKISSQVEKTFVLMNLIEVRLPLRLEERVDPFRNKNHISFWCSDDGSIVDIVKSSQRKRTMKILPWLTFVLLPCLLQVWWR